MEPALPGTSPPPTPSAEGRSDSERLALIDGAFAKQSGSHTKFILNGFQFTRYPEGWHVAKDEFTDPITDGDSLGSAIDAAMERDSEQGGAK